MGQIGTRIRRAFVRRFTATQGANVVGRVIPFGIGAVIGGTGNHLVGRRIVASSREAFGPVPAAFPEILDVVVRPPRERRLPAIRRRRRELLPPPNALDRLPD
jgi:hypothetical protein